MEETKTQRGIRHSKTGTIAALVIGFAGQFFGFENPLDQLDRIEYNQRVIMQSAGIKPTPLPPDVEVEELMDAMDTLRKLERPATKPTTQRISNPAPPLRAMAL